MESNPKGAANVLSEKLNPNQNAYPFERWDQRILRKMSSFLPIQTQPSSAVKETDMDMSLSRDVPYIYHCEQRFLCAGTNILKKRISGWGRVGEKGFLLMSRNATLEGEHS